MEIFSALVALYKSVAYCGHSGQAAGPSVQMNHTQSSLSCGTSVSDSSSATDCRERLSGAEHGARLWHPLALVWAGALSVPSLLGCPSARGTSVYFFLNDDTVLCFYYPSEKVKVKTYVTESCPTLWDRVDCSLPSFSIPGISQARILE